MSSFSYGHPLYYGHKKNILFTTNNHFVTTSLYGTDSFPPLAIIDADTDSSPPLVGASYQLSITSTNHLHDL